MILLEMCIELYLQSEQTHCILASGVTFLELAYQHFRGNFWLNLQRRQFVHRPIYHTTRRHCSEGSGIYSYMPPTSHIATAVQSFAHMSCARVGRLNSLQDPVSRWNQFKGCR